MFKSVYQSWLGSFHHGDHGVTSAPKPPVMPPMPPMETPAPTTTGGTQVGGVGGMMTPGASTSNAGFGGVAAAGFFVAGFGADFFNQYNPMMSGLAQMGGFGNCWGAGGYGGFGGFGGAQMPMAQPLTPKIAETKLEHCGYKAGTQNTLEVGSHKFVDRGHGQMEITGQNGKKFTVDVNRCSAPPQIEIHADGNKKEKAMMKVPLSELKEGGSISLPDGTKLAMKSNAAGNNLESFQVQSAQGQVLGTMEGFDKGNAAWKTGGEAMKLGGPQMSASASLDSITKGGANPTPGQIAQGNFNHLNPMGNFMQNQMPGLMQNPAPQMQQAGQQLQMLFSMIQLLQSLAQMFQMTRGSMFSMIR